MGCCSLSAQKVLVGRNEQVAVLPLKSPILAGELERTGACIESNVQRLVTAYLTPILAS